MRPSFGFNGSADGPARGRVRRVVLGIGAACWPKTSWHGLTFPRLTVRTWMALPCGRTTRMAHAKNAPDSRVARRSRGPWRRAEASEVASGSAVCDRHRRTCCRRGADAVVPVEVTDRGGRRVDCQGGRAGLGSDVCWHRYFSGRNGAAARRAIDQSRDGGAGGDRLRQSAGLATAPCGDHLDGRRNHCPRRPMRPGLVYDSNARFWPTRCESGASRCCWVSSTTISAASRALNDARQGRRGAALGWHEQGPRRSFLSGGRRIERAGHRGPWRGAQTGQADLPGS